jgi:uncharacterized protein YecT (DUF1311 family)
MDFQQARQRRGEPTAEATALACATRRKRAADARLRRAIREALARQKGAPTASPDAAQPDAAQRLRAVRDDRL